MKYSDDIKKILKIKDYENLNKDSLIWLNKLKSSLIENQNGYIENMKELNKIQYEEFEKIKPILEKLVSEKK